MPSGSRRRLEVRLVGTVQGVGFRPFVYRLARELELDGWVLNDGAGVQLEVEGEHRSLLRFLERLPREKPAACRLYAMEHRLLAPAGHRGFEIRPSDPDTPARSWVLPDLALCEACRGELLDPTDRRHRYPFLNCTDCGPRYTIIERLPYDRDQTTMRRFEMCSDCATEYRRPDDRRFHAQPIACPRCGPRLSLATTDTGEPVVDDAALAAALRALEEGKIVGVKGLGGFHLMVDAGNDSAIRELRRRKRRSGKALAVMVPDLESAGALAHLSPLARTLLGSAQAPIVLLRRRAEAEGAIAPSVAPGSPYLGLFLPYTPLHLLLLRGAGRPLVATSGNLSDEPIQHRDEAASSALFPICDLILTHDRPIARPVDDSVLQIHERPRPRVQSLRRARGYAPLPLLAPRELPPLLALGGQMNVTVALAREREVIVSQHLGDMETLESREAFAATVQDLQRLFEQEARAVAHDLHPDYFTTAFAEESGLPRIAVQHHHAHLAACMLENEVEEETLGLTWDGTGFGPDGTVWGGEFLLGTAAGFRRVATLRPFVLPGGERAIHEPWRVAVALLEAAGIDSPLSQRPSFADVDPVRVEAVRRLAAGERAGPRTTSVGRLFDGISALLGLCTRNSHQAEAAQQLEYAAWRAGTRAEPLTMPLREDGTLVRLDWEEAVRQLVRARSDGEPVDRLAARFHHGLADAALEMVRRQGCPRVALTGGVFCNRYLGELLTERLEASGFQVLQHGQLPPTDGSLAVGQLAVAAYRFERDGATG